MPSFLLIPHCRTDYLKSSNSPAQSLTGKAYSWTAPWPKRWHPSSLGCQSKVCVYVIFFSLLCALPCLPRPTPLPQVSAFKELDTVWKKTNKGGRGVGACGWVSSTSSGFQHCTDSQPCLWRKCHKNQHFRSQLQHGTGCTVSWYFEPSQPQRIVSGLENKLYPTFYLFCTQVIKLQDLQNQLPSIHKKSAWIILLF